MKNYGLNMILANIKYVGHMGFQLTLTAVKALDHVRSGTLFPMSTTNSCHGGLTVAEVCVCFRN